MRELLWRHVVILLHQRAIARHRHHTESLAASTPVAPFRLRGPSRHHRRIVAADSRRQIHTFERLAACWLVVRSPMRTRARPTLQSSLPDVRLCTHCLSQMRATSLTGFFGAPPPPLPSPPAGHTHRRLQQGEPAGGGLSLGPSYRMGGPGIEPSPHPLHRTPTCRRGVGCQLSHVALATVERWLVGLRPVRGVEDASPLAGERLG